MRQLLLFTLLLIGIQVSAQTNKDQSAKKAKEPTFFVNFPSGKRPSATNTPQVIKEKLGLDTSDQLVKQKTERDKLGMTHEQYNQYYKGVKVEYSIIKAHSRNGSLEVINGEAYQIPEMAVNPALAESAALQKAMAFVGARSYKWQNQEEEKWIKKEQKDPKATFYPKGELVICRDYLNNPEEEKMVLAYKFDIYATEPLSRDYIYVDAVTGKVIHRNPIIKHADGTADTRYSGIRTIQTELSNATYRLRNPSRGGGIETYNLQKSTNFSTAIDFTDADNNWTAAEYDNANKDNAALDAHWGAQRVYDYWKNVHGRLGLDGTNGKVKSYVHFGNNIDNAFWDGTAMLYGDGNTLFRPLTSIDIVAHEFGHGVMEYTANLVYQNEPGALNEGFSDIWGAVIEYYAAPEKQTWLIGEEIALTAPALRSMSDPNSGSPRQPDTYKGNYWYTGFGDNGGVHYNSGVLNFWFYLLTVGKSGTNDNGSNYAVTGIGIDKAANIAYRAQSVYLGPNSQYQDARTATVQAASDLYGASSNEVNQVINAWNAVGVTAPVTLTLATVSDTQIGLSWQVQENNITSYRLFRSLLPNSGFAQIALTDANTTTYTDQGLTAGNTYYYFVGVTLGNGFTFFSSVQSLVLGVPAAPTLLAANVTGNTVNLSWQDNSPNETYFLVERSLSQGSGFVQVAQLPANTTTYQETPPMNIYYYRVRALRANLSLYSPYSNTAMAVVGNIIVMSNTPVTTCEELYLDPGGNFDYGLNQNVTQTFTPASPDSKLRVVFNSFSLESGFDFLYIYDGNSTAATLIGIYSGTVSPGTITATNATGQLTFRFTSDDSVIKPGWSATVSCVPVPVAQAQQLSGNEDQNLPLTLTATGPAAPVFEVVSGPQHGTLSGTLPDLTYTPQADYFGEDAFTFKASANGFSSEPATISLTINAVNDAPVFTKGTDRTVNEDALAQTVTGWATGISSGPSNESGQIVSFSLVADQPGLFTVQPALTASGNLTYTPAPHAYGTTGISVTLSDDGGTANGGVNQSSSQSFDITLNAVNDAPSFIKGPDVTVDEDTGPQTVAGWATAISAGPANESEQILSFTVSAGQPGLFLVAPAITADGTLSFTPAANVSGNTTVSVKLMDNGGTANGGVNQSAEQTFTITMNAVNDAPVAVNDSYSTNEDTQLTVPAPGVLSNDTDNDNDVLQAILVYGTSHGTLTLNTNGSFIYTPTANYFGPDSFTYRAGDGAATSNTATVSIQVQSVNDQPMSADDAYEMDEGTSQNVAAPGLLSNDTDVEGSALTVVLVSGPSHGSLTLNPNGSFSYTPSAGYNGPESFTYKANDGTANGNTATVNITVKPVNDAPVVSNSLSSQLVQYSDAVTAVTITATDADNDPITIKKEWKKSGAIGFSSGLPGNLILTAGPNYTWSLTGKMQVAPGEYIIRITANDGTAFANNSGYTDVTITVIEEDALTTYTGTAFVFTSGTTSTTANVLLSATIQDISVVNLTDAAPGDIKKASLKFRISQITSSGETFVKEIPATTLTYVNASDLRTAIASASWTANIGSADALMYKVELIVGGYYRENPVNMETITVSKPLPDFVVGGGTVLPKAPAGLITGAGSTAGKVHVGVSIKYTKNGSSPKGFVNLFIRRQTNGVSQVFQVKSNAFSSFGVQRTSPAKASVVTKANILEIGSGKLKDWGGNFTVNLTIVDNGTPGTKDVVAITIYDKANKLWYAANWNGAKSLEQNLYTGNFSINSSSSFGPLATAKEAAEEISGLSVHLRSYPNPVAESTTIAFSFPEEEQYVLEVYDTKGVLISLLQQGTAKAGEVYQLIWQVNQNRSGVYLIRLTSNRSIQHLKLMVR